MCIEMCAKREYEGQIEGVLLNESWPTIVFFSHKLNYSQLKIIRLKANQFIRNIQSQFNHRNGYHFIDRIRLSFGQLFLIVNCRKIVVFRRYAVWQMYGQRLAQKFVPMQNCIKCSSQDIFVYVQHLRCLIVFCVLNVYRQHSCAWLNVYLVFGFYYSDSSQDCWSVTVVIVVRYSDNNSSYNAHLCIYFRLRII